MAARSAPAAFVHYGVVMEEGSMADADSFVMKGEVLEANSIWRGNPAKPHRFIAPAQADDRLEEEAEPCRMAAE